MHINILITGNVRNIYDFYLALSYLKIISLEMKIKRVVFSTWEDIDQEIYEYLLNNGVEVITQNLAYPDARYILIARKEHMNKEKELVTQIEKEFNAIFIPIEKLTEGTACTVLYARKFINNEDPLLIANSDQIVDINIADFINDCKNRKLDGSILTFIDEFKDPKWSFAKINKNNLVTEVKEKVVISDYATVGIYYYTKGKDFVNAAIDMIIDNERVNDEFYTCPTYNYAIKDNAKIGIYNIEFEQMHGIGTPDDLNSYLKRK